MKSLKVVLASLFLSIGAVAISSFTVESYNSKAFVTKCYEFLSPTGKLVVNDPLNLNFVDFNEFRSISNWTERTGIPSSATCPDGVKICRLCFDDTQLTGGITFEDVIEGLYTHLVDLPGDPPHGTSITISVNGSNFNVIIYEKA